MSEENQIESNSKNKVGQEQIHGLLFGQQLSWQSIILDLINAEQLDPWDIDLVLLSQKYLERVKEIEEANLFVSSKVLFAAALLLRMKSEILLNEYIPSLDSILFGKKEEKKYVQERIELEEEVPGLIQRTPLPRFRKVTLEELMSALGKAITTENRRIKKVIVAKQQEIETAISIPKARINLRDRITEVYSKLKHIFLGKEEKIPFSKISGQSSEEKVSTFVPLLHLDNQHKVFLEQEKHFEEIYVWMKEHYEKEFAAELEQMKKEAEVEAMKMSLEEKEIDEKEKKEEHTKKLKSSKTKSKKQSSEKTAPEEELEENWENAEETVQTKNEDFKDEEDKETE